MSYISGCGGVTSMDAPDQPVDQRERGGRRRAAEGRGGLRFVPDLYPRPAVLLDREDRKAGQR